MMCISIPYPSMTFPMVSGVGIWLLGIIAILIIVRPGGRQIKENWKYLLAWPIVIGWLGGILLWMMLVVALSSLWNKVKISFLKRAG